MRGRLNSEIDKHLVIKIGVDNYAIPVNLVLEVLTPHNTTKVPNVPKYVRGIMNLRGRLLPVIDAIEFFEAPPKDRETQECFVMVEFQEYVLTIVCHEVMEVIEIKEDEIQAEVHRAPSYITGLFTNDKGSFTVLDLEKLLTPISTTING